MTWGIKAETCRFRKSLSGRVLSLPMHTELEEEQLVHICEQIKAYFNS